MINTENWTHCQYKKDHLRALLHLGADWNGTESKLLYYFNILDPEDIAVHQKDFASLDEAIAFTNKLCAQWEFEDMEGSPTDSGGCSSCQAK